MKHGFYIHLMFALGAEGSIDATGRETLFYRGTNKRKRAQASTLPAGRPRTNGQALQTEWTAVTAKTLEIATSTNEKTPFISLTDSVW
jgi:hypothetical protein